VFDISPIQIIIVLGLALLVFGPKRLPELGRNLGKGIRDFRGGLTGDGSEPEVTELTGGPAAQPAEPTSQQLVAEASGPSEAGEPALAAAGHPVGGSS
jgi:sec-independent protein translocase protein TatA